MNMKRFFLVFTFPVFLFGINISNKQGSSFDAEFIELILMPEGKESIKVRRSSDKRIFLIPLNSLSDKTLISIIREQDKLNKAIPVPNLVAAPIQPKQNNIPAVANNKNWKDFDSDKIVDFRSNPLRWNGKTVKVVGNFEYKSSLGESFSMEQGDDDINVVYKGLTRREKEEVLRQENFSNVLIKVSGRLEKHSFSENSFDIIAKKVEFLK
jgi:hypothetical protein